MRYSGPINFSWLGDPDIAQNYLPVARGLLGFLAKRGDLSNDQNYFASEYIELEDGTIIFVRYIGDYVRDVFIDARLSQGLAFETLQYMFTLRGAGGTVAPVVSVTDDFDLVQSAWVGIIAILKTAGEPEIFTFPLVSTRSDIQPTAGETWPYVEITAGTYPASLNTAVTNLPIERYEVIHAEAAHLEQPDKFNLVHAPWNQQGIPPYNAFTFTKASQWTIGVGSGVTQTRNSPSSVTSVPNEDLQYIQWTRATDVGYETDLDIYQRPTLDGLTPKQGDSPGGVPDADWYTSYSRVVVTDEEFGSHEFGVLIDANQKLYVWPVEAEGTGSTAGSLYLDQSIKTSVDPQYVQTHQLVFPSGVHVGDISYRDNFGTDAYGYTVLNFDSSRYTWVPDSTGTEFATVGVKYHGMGVDPNDSTNELELYWGEFGHIAGGTTPPSTAKRTHRTPETVVLQFGLSVSVIGAALEDFEISVGQPAIQPVADTFYPVHVGFSGSNGFSGAAKDELLVAGIEAHYMGNGSGLVYPAHNDVRANLAVIAGWWCRHFAALNPPSGFAPFFGTQYFSLVEGRGRYASLGDTESANGTTAAISKWYHDSCMEATLSVRKTGAEGATLASWCIRKALFEYYEPFEGPDYFTAQLVDIDFKTGTVAFAAKVAKQDAALKALYAAGNTPETSPWTSTNVTCTFAQGMYIFQRGATLYEWTQDASMPGYFSYTPVGPTLDKNREEGGITGTLVAADYFLGDYLIDLFNHPGGGTSGLFSFTTYLLGMETYAALYARHVATGAPLGGLMVNEDLVSFTGSLFCFENAQLTTNASTNEATGVNTVFNKEIDLLIIGGLTLSHKELWEQAFNRTIDTEMDLRVETEVVDTWRGSGGVDIDMYRNNIIVRDEGSTDTFKINIDEPWAWMYSGFHKGRIMAWGWYAQELNNPGDDARIGREQRTLLDPTFGGRAYGYTE